MNGAIKKASGTNHEKACFALANEVAKDSNYFVPMDTGALRMEVEVNKRNQIIYRSPYAEHMYYSSGLEYTQLNTGGRWNEKAEAIHGEKWKKVYTRALGVS